METQQNTNQIESKKLNIGFFFLSLGLIISLITSIVSFLGLAFSALDKKFPDVLNASYQYGYNDYSFESMRVALSTLIIFFPVFLVIAYFWTKYKDEVLSITDKLIKKWLIYIVLFLSALVVVIDLVTLVRYFVSGEITTRFILKVLITLIIALFVGIYYIFELKNKNKILGVPIRLASTIKSSVFVILLIVFSFMVMGSPLKQRDLKLDQRRIDDLQSIQWGIINFWQQKEKLPNNLEELKNPLSGFYLPIDPEFDKGKSYEYFKKDDLTFELCATFSLDMPKGWQEYRGGGGIMPMYEKSVSDVAVSYPYPYGGANDSWDHKAGRTCFERKIDKDLYPPFPKN